MGRTDDYGEVNKNKIMNKLTSIVSIILSTASFTYALITHNWWLLAGLLIGMIAIIIRTE